MAVLLRDETRGRATGFGFALIAGGGGFDLIGGGTFFAKPCVGLAQRPCCRKHCVSS